MTPCRFFRHKAFVVRTLLSSYGHFRSCSIKVCRKNWSSMCSNLRSNMHLWSIKYVIAAACCHTRRPSGCMRVDFTRFQYGQGPAEPVAGGGLPADGGMAGRVRTLAAARSLGAAARDVVWVDGVFLQAHGRPRRMHGHDRRDDRKVASRPNETWAMDFVHDQLATGTKLRVLTIVDTFSRMSPAIVPRLSFRGADVVEVLERVCRAIGFPAAIRVDQDSEFVSRDLDLWAYQRGVTLDFSRPGKPTDNAFIESFNGKFRAECLNAHWFMSLDDARVENARLGVETITRRDPTARSATKPRSSSSTDQRPSARPDRNTLEKAQPGGPRLGAVQKPENSSLRRSKVRSHSNFGPTQPMTRGESGSRSTGLSQFPIFPQAAGMGGSGIRKSALESRSPGVARLWTDQHAQGRRLADARHTIHRHDDRDSPLRNGLVNRSGGQEDAAEGATGERRTGSVLLTVRPIIYSAACISLLRRGRLSVSSIASSS